MKNVKSEARERLSALAFELFSGGALKKVVLSKPDATDEIKSTLVPMKISGNTVLQLETTSVRWKGLFCQKSAALERALVPKSIEPRSPAIAV